MGADVTSNPIKTIEKVSRNDFLADIRSGIKLKNSKRTVKVKPRPILGTRLVFQEESNRSDFGNLSADNSSSVTFAKVGNVAEPLMGSQNPQNVLLEAAEDLTDSVDDFTDGLSRAQLSTTWIHERAHFVIEGEDRLYVVHSMTPVLHTETAAIGNLHAPQTM